MKKKEKENQKMYNKLLDQETQYEELKKVLLQKEAIISSKEDTIDEQLETLEARDGEIGKLKATVMQLDKYRVENESHCKLLKTKNEEMGVLRAKLMLDLIEFEVNVVAEYPDMVEENNNLLAEVDEYKQ